MILYADGHPTRRRYSVGFTGSLLFHVVLVMAVLWQASSMGPASDSSASRSGSGRYNPRHPASVVGAGNIGDEPTGTIGAMPTPAAVAASWPVRQAERLRLRLGVGWMIDHVWQSTLFALAMGVLTLAFRRNRARVRYALWFAASAKFLVPFALFVWLGSLLGPSARDVLGITGASDSAAASHPLGAAGQWLAATGTLALSPSAFTIDEVTAAWFSIALLVIWTVGFFGIIASRLRLSQQLWDIALSSRRVELLDVKVPARLQVGLADGLLEPGVIGWVNPVMLLPADIERHLTRPEIEAIVEHELCHVRRFDNMTAAIHMLVEAIFWFHPLVWWLGARLVEERECACDEHVLRSTGAPGPYAQGILNICKRYVKSPLASVSGIGSANVKQRIESILANHVGETTSPWKRVMLSGIILCVVIVPLAAGALQPPLPRATSSRDASIAGVSVATPYELVLANADGQLGPGLRQPGLPHVEDDSPALSGIVRPREISSDYMTTRRLAEVLSSVVGGAVEDRTGLEGHFAVRLTWTSDPRGPSLFTALEQQLGLRLVPVRSETR